MWSELLRRQVSPEDLILYVAAGVVSAARAPCNHLNDSRSTVRSMRARPPVMRRVTIPLEGPLNTHCLTREERVV